MELIKRVLRPLILWLQTLVAKPDVSSEQSLSADEAQSKIGNLAADNLVTVTEVIDKKSVSSDEPESSSSESKSPESTLQESATVLTENTKPQADIATRSATAIAESSSRPSSVSESVEKPVLETDDEAVNTPMAEPVAESLAEPAPEPAGGSTAGNDTTVDSGINNRENEEPKTENDNNADEIADPGTHTGNAADGSDSESNTINDADEKGDLAVSAVLAAASESKTSARAIDSEPANASNEPANDIDAETDLTAEDQPTEIGELGDSDKPNEPGILDDSDSTVESNGADGADGQMAADKVALSESPAEADGSKDANDADTTDADTTDAVDGSSESDESNSVDGSEDAADEGETANESDRAEDASDSDELGDSGELSDSDESADSGEPPKPLRLLKIDDQDVTLLTLVESLLFVAETAAEPKQFAEVLDVPLKDVEAALAQLAENYVEQGSGLRIQERGGKYTLVSMPLAAQAIEDFLNLDLNSRLSSAALETLAIVAYRQPVTRIQVESVRGVDCGGVLRTLLQRELVAEVGRLEAAGRPILYGVTDLFMQHFGLTTMDELPSLETTDADLLWAATQLDDEDEEGEAGDEGDEGDEDSDTPEPSKKSGHEASVEADDEAGENTGENPGDDVDPDEAHPNQKVQDEQPANEDSDPTPDNPVQLESEETTNEEVKSND